MDDIDFFSDIDSDFEDTVQSNGLRSTFGKVVGEARSRLSRGDGTGEQLNPDARLASVVSESTPGAALELMRLNERFAFPELNAYVLLVLPTVGDFGGLSRRSKDEARGTIINLINADNIHAVVTAELLADDALGIVPDAESLARMDEISLLTNARYLYGVACEDAETGEVKVFSVPPISEETAVHGLLFPQAVGILQGEFELTSVLDSSLVAAMLTIYRSAADAMSGTAALNKAEEMNLEFVVKAVSQGGYPTAAELIANLVSEFPVLADQSGAAEDASEPVDDDSDDGGETAEAAFTDTAEDFGGVDMSEEVGFVDDSDLDLELRDTGFEPEPDDPVFSDAVEEPDFGDADTDEEPDWSEPDFGDTTPDGGTDTAAVQAIVRATEGQMETLRAELSGLVEQIKNSLDPAQRSTEERLSAAGGMDRPGPIPVEPGSAFTYDQALEAAGRTYGGDDLELAVDPQLFKQRLISPIPQIPVPRGKYTPWLGEQAETMAQVLNEQLRKLHVDNEMMLYRQFMHMADLAAKEISLEFDPQRNPDSRWGRVYAAIHSDKEKITERAASAKLRAEEAVRNLWNDRAEVFVSDAAARARQEFEHRNGAHIEADVRKAGDQVLAELEAMSVLNLAELNESRRVSARLQMDEKLSDILHSLENKALEQQSNESAAFEAALAAVTSYIDEHRKDDLVQSDVTARKLETDARYDQLMNEAQAQINAARAEADTRIEMMKAEMRHQTESYERGIALKTSNFQLEKDNQLQREKALEQRLEQIRIDHENEQSELMRRADARVEMADKARDEAIADWETLRERNSRLTTVAVVLVVLGAILLVSGGILVGVFLI